MLIHDDDSASDITDPGAYHPLTEERMQELDWRFQNMKNPVWGLPRRPTQPKAQVKTPKASRTLIVTLKPGSRKRGAEQPCDELPSKRRRQSTSVDDSVRRSRTPRETPGRGARTNHAGPLTPPEEDAPTKITEREVGLTADEESGLSGDLETPVRPGGRPQELAASIAREVGLEARKIDTRRRRRRSQAGTAADAPSSWKGRLRPRTKRNGESETRRRENPKSRHVGSSGIKKRATTARGGRHAAVK